MALGEVYRNNCYHTHCLHNEVKANRARILRLLILALSAVVLVLQHIVVLLNKWQTRTHSVEERPASHLHKKYRATVTVTHRVLTVKPFNQSLIFYWSTTDQKPSIFTGAFRTTFFCRLKQFKMEVSDVSVCVCVQGNGQPQIEAPSFYASYFFLPRVAC